jgi:hypothetical protein
MSNLKEESRKKATYANQETTGIGGALAGCVGLDADAGYREPSLRERLMGEKARIQRDASARIRKINNALVELENTEAEDVVARAREVLSDVR